LDLEVETIKFMDNNLNGASNLNIKIKNLARKTESSSFVVTAKKQIVQFFNTYLNENQLKLVQTSYGESILTKYCSLLEEWDNSLFKLLSDDWDQGIIKCPLASMKINCNYVIAMTYPASKTYDKPFYACSTSKVISSYLEKKILTK
jgi:hypothetical protein